MEEWPDARHVLVVRRGYDELAPLFPKGLEWVIADLNPFTQRPAECRESLTRLMAALRDLQPDLILAPTLNRTWLEIAVAAQFRDVRSVVLGEATVDPNFATTLRLDLRIDAEKVFGERIFAAPTDTDVENQHRFAEKVIGRPLNRSEPRVEVSKSFSAAARTLAAQQGLVSGKWAAVFAGGLANVAVKAWSASGFAEVAIALQNEFALPVLLMGHQAESDWIEEVAGAVAARGASRPPVWLGRTGELPILAGLLSDAALYVGHDTSALHLACAVGRPAVGIFGGGHWPRFRPPARRAAAVVQPLPCFGCNWDCHFGDGPCVKLIPAADVLAGVRRLLDAGEHSANFVVESHPLPAEAVHLIASALPGINALQRARVDRQHKIEELKAETDSKDIEISDLKRAAEERKAEMEAIKTELENECAGKDREISELKGELDVRAAEISELKRAADERKAEMEAIKAELEQECEGKDREIAQLKAEATEKDGEIERLKVVCDDREELVKRLDAGLRAHIDASQAREAKVAELQAERDRLAVRLDLLGNFPADAEVWAAAIRDKDVHIANLDTTIAGLERQVQNYAGGYGNIEQAKHYGKLLAEKEAMIQDLHRACVERAAVIAQLTADATAPTAGLRRLWTGTVAFVRQRIIGPMRQRIFRAVVEDYWMQIGMLRHYEPRPILWDKRLPRVLTDRHDLPKLGIVTPSYGQAAFVESTILSVLNQNYPKLVYVVQDGGSKDASASIIARYESRLHRWSSERDRGQADAIRKGFSHIEPELSPTDVMGWFNSDDLVAPRALGFVATYFADHPDVDVVYGHRIIIDEQDREVGRWIMPRHEAASIEWIDYVPQETLFWRKRAWDIVGGIDPAFQFALDWDLLARFHQAGYKIVRLPFFLGCFRVHSQQKTSQAIHTTGAAEMAQIRRRFHGAQGDNTAMIERHARRIRFRGALTARLLAAGIRW